MPDCPTRTLLRAGTLALFSATLLAPLAPAGAPHALAAEDGGEGGEGGEGGGEGGDAAPSYALNSTDPAQWSYDAGPALTAYAEGAFARYDAARMEAERLQAAVMALLAAPSQATLDAARAAWVAARPAYLVTEAYRFTDGPIEAIEGEINAWPMNEAFLDYTVETPDGGLINDPVFDPSDIAIIADLNQVQDEADVTTGWHAIEFLLWGQDLSAEGPGARPYTDYVRGTGAADKRRVYLLAVTKKLASDLERLAAEWKPDARNYRASFLALPPREGVGRMLNGLAVLAGHEFRSERLAVALDSGDQEDEHSCF
jgi:putative iron-regulated protein